MGILDEVETFESGGEVKVVVPAEHYKKLLKASHKLNALENGGVGNWDWYDESLKEFYEMDEEGFFN